MKHSSKAVLACLPIEPIGVCKPDLALDIYGADCHESRRRVGMALADLRKKGLLWEKKNPEAPHGRKQLYGVRREEWMRSQVACGENPPMTLPLNEAQARYKRQLKKRSADPQSHQ